MFECLQQDDPITATICQDYTPPLGFSGTNDLFESCRHANCPKHGSIKHPQQQCLYHDQRSTHLSHMGRYRWFLIGGRGTGVKPHTDPAGTCAWNACIVGRKRWIFFPPSTLKSTLLLEEHGDAASWFDTSYPRLPKEGLPGQIEVIHEAGQVVYVPPNWWHCVVNLEFTIAVTHSFGSARTKKERERLFHEFEQYDEISARAWWCSNSLGPDSGTHDSVGGEVVSGTEASEKSIDVVVVTTPLLE